MSSVLIECDPLPVSQLVLGRWFSTLILPALPAHDQSGLGATGVAGSAMIFLRFSADEVWLPVGGAIQFTC